MKTLKTVAAVFVAVAVVAFAFAVAYNGAQLTANYTGPTIEKVTTTDSRTWDHQAYVGRNHFVEMTLPSENSPVVASADRSFCVEKVESVSNKSELRDYLKSVADDF